MITFSINLGSVGDVLNRFYFVTPVGGDTANYDFVSFFNQLRECAILWIQLMHMGLLQEQIQSCTTQKSSSIISEEFPVCALMFLPHGKIFFDHRKSAILKLNENDSNS